MGWLKKVLIATVSGVVRICSGSFLSLKPNDHLPPFRHIPERKAKRAKLAARSLDDALHRITSLHITVNSKTTPNDWRNDRTREAWKAVRCRVHLRVESIKKLQVDLILCDRTVETYNYLLWLLLPFKKLYGMQSVKFRVVLGKLYPRFLIQGMR